MGDGVVGEDESPGTYYLWNAVGSGYDGQTHSPLGLWFPESCLVPESHVAVPSDMLPMGDIGGNPGVTLWEGMGGFGWPGAVLSYHPDQRNNALFCDGHVETSDSRYQAKTKSASGITHFVPDASRVKRWNRDNQPHPETWPVR